MVIAGCPAGPVVRHLNDEIELSDGNGNENGAAHENVPRTALRVTASDGEWLI